MKITTMGHLCGSMVEINSVIKLGSNKLSESYFCVYIKGKTYDTEFTLTPFGAKSEDHNGVDKMERCEKKKY